jgi:predicted nucleotidyltransferase
MREKALEIIKKLKSLISQKVAVHEVRVFGSRARSDDTAESDLDVLIAVNNLDYTIEKYISDRAWEVGFPEDIIIVPVAISLDMLKNSPLRESAFISNVYPEGISM